MKKIIIILLLLSIILITGCNLNHTRKEIPVYFVGGQSNANTVFYNTIKENIVSQDPEAIVLHLNHGGQPIENWYYNGVKENLLKDFTVIKDGIKNIDYDFKGFIWWQGETNRNNFIDYEYRFSKMINLYKSIIDYKFNIYMVIPSAEIGNTDLDNIRDVQIKIGHENDNIYFVDSYGHPKLNELTSHMENAEYIKIGNELSNVILDIEY